MNLSCKHQKWVLFLNPCSTKKQITKFRPSPLTLFLILTIWFSKLLEDIGHHGRVLKHICLCHQAKKIITNWNYEANFVIHVAIEKCWFNLSVTEHFFLTLIYANGKVKWHQSIKESQILPVRSLVIENSILLTSIQASDYEIWIVLQTKIINNEFFFHE